MIRVKFKIAPVILNNSEIVLLLLLLSFNIIFQSNILMFMAFIVGIIMWTRLNALIFIMSGLLIYILDTVFSQSFVILWNDFVISMNVVVLKLDSNIVVVLGLSLGGVFYIATTFIKKYFILNSMMGMVKEDLAHVNASDGANSLLGYNAASNQKIYLSDIDANHHTFAIGTTGSGKTTALMNIVESAIDRKIGLVYVDGKGDRNLANKIEKYAKKQGVPFYLFSMSGSDLKYNPLASGGFTSKKDRIIELRTWSEDHYRKIAEGYLQSVFKVLEKAKIDADIVSLAKHLELDDLFLWARRLGDKPLMKELSRLEGSRKDISSLIAEIENLASSEIGHLFDCSQGTVLTLNEVCAQNAIAYFCLSPLAFPAYAKTLGKLIINDLKAVISEQLAQTHKNTMYTIFDEFSVFAGDQVINLINQGREAGVCAVLPTQSLSDIEKQGGRALVGQVINNCNNYIIQRQNNPEDANMLAEIIGTQESFDHRLNISQDSVSRSLMPNREYIVHPENIKRLKKGQAIVLNKIDFCVQEANIRKGKI